MRCSTSSHTGYKSHLPSFFFCFFSVWPSISLRFAIDLLLCFNEHILDSSSSIWVVQRWWVWVTRSRRSSLEAISSLQFFSFLQSLCNFLLFVQGNKGLCEGDEAN